MRLRCPLCSLAAGFGGGTGLLPPSTPCASGPTNPAPRAGPHGVPRWAAGGGVGAPSQAARSLLPPTPAPRVCAWPRRDLTASGRGGDGGGEDPGGHGPGAELGPPPPSPPGPVPRGAASLGARTLTPSPLRHEGPDSGPPGSEWRPCPWHPQVDSGPCRCWWVRLTPPSPRGVSLICSPPPQICTLI